MSEEGLQKCAIIMDFNHVYQLQLTVNPSSKVLLPQIASFT